MSNHLIISHPKPDEYPGEFEPYIRLVPSVDLLKYFQDQTESIASVIAGLSEEKLLYRYAQGKWSIKDICCHVIDSERIYCYRALCIARGETAALPGFEENAYAKEARADRLRNDDILSEYHTVRASTVSLFRSFDEIMLNRIGVANGKRRSVRAIGFMAAGHELHHVNVIKERYLA